MKTITFVATSVDRGFNVFITGEYVSLVDLFLMEKVLFLHSECDTLFSDWLYNYIENNGITIHCNYMPVTVKDNSFQFSVCSLMTKDESKAQAFVAAITEFYEKELVVVTSTYKNILHQ
jgi:hypothetical protein